MTRRLLSIAMLAVAAVSPLLAQDDVAALVQRATQYVEDYEATFAAVVCEERQTQRVVRPDGTVAKERQLVSDVLLIKYGLFSRTFRDVSRVDGKAVGDRQERLARLFREGGQGLLPQAQAISRESTRYNIGFHRDLDTLMLPIAVLQKMNVPKLTFHRTADGLSFEEINSPTMVRYNDGRGGQDLPLRGSFTMTDAGQVTGASLVAQSPAFTVTVNLRYTEDAKTGVLVPTDSRERYEAPKEKDHLEVISTYTNFRKFEVRTDEQIANPAQ